MKFTAIGLAGVVGISLIWLAIANAAADGRLEKKLAALKAAGQPLTPQELARKPIPPETNAATFLRRAQMDVDAIQKTIQTAIDASPQPDSEAMARGQLSPTLQKVFRAAFDAHPLAIPLLTQATDCKEYDPQINYDLDDGAFTQELIGQFRQLRSDCRVLNYYVLLTLAEGKHEEAFAACLALLRLSRQAEQNPALVGYLVALALRDVAIHAASFVLQAGSLPEAAHDALEAELSRHDSVQAFRRAMAMERAIVLARFPEGLGAAYARLPAGKDDQCDFLDVIEVASSGASRPFFDSEIDKLDEIRMRGGANTSQLAPSIAATRMAMARSQSLVSSLRVLNALERRKPTDQPKLSDLGLDPAVLVDPFDGKPLRVKKLPDGWVVYSIGVDQRDDGGQVEHEADGSVKDVGLGPVKASQSEQQKPAD